MPTNFNKYLFSSPRLGFRTWSMKDLEHMASLNRDPEVMKHFPFIPSEKETELFIKRMITQYNDQNFCYFPIELLASGRFIGFIGLSIQNLDTDFTPCIDIGWRINKDYWGKGLATEGALRCLKYAKKQLDIECIYAIAPKTNSGSIMVMKKIGMNFIKDFEHPKLIEHSKLKSCVLYGIDLNKKL